MTIKVITAPQAEPISLSKAKLHLRVDTDADDTLITGLITAARMKVEELSWHALITQTLELVLDEWPCEDEIELPRPPLQSVTYVTYRMSDGTVTTLDPSLYVVAGDSIPAEIEPAYMHTWPTVVLYPVEAIRVRYVCGFGLTGKDVPQVLRQAMLLTIAFLYENREAGAGLPGAVDMLCVNYRKKVMR